MPAVFSYGSLQRGDKQIANVVRGAHTSRVAGTVLEFTAAQLITADEYERADSYKRIRVLLESGIEAWVYVDAS